MWSTLRRRHLRRGRYVLSEDCVEDILLESRVGNKILEALASISVRLVALDWGG